MEKMHVAFMALFCGVLVFAIKLLAYAVSNSAALLSDALESIANISASGMMLFSVLISKKPADDGHNYGHEKVEELSCMLEGTIVLSTAGVIIYAAVGRLSKPIELLELDLAIGISVAATLLNAGLSIFMAKTANKIGSPAIEGDAKHLFSDVLSSIGVWLGLVIVKFTGFTFIDIMLALSIAILIGRMGIVLILKSSDVLMDRSCLEAERKIREVLLRHKYRFIDFHDVRTRRNGSQVFAELHLSVDGSLTVEESHNLTDHLEQELKEELPSLTLTIHVEPKTR
jgi:cation diffusion facilitator family transporter